MKTRVGGFATRPHRRARSLSGMASNVVRWEKSARRDFLAFFPNSLYNAGIGFSTEPAKRNPSDIKEYMT